MLRSFDFEVIIQPRPWKRSGYNRKTGRHYTVTSDVHMRQAIQDAFRSAIKPLVDSCQVELPLQGPIRLAVTAFLPLPKATPKKRRMSALPVGNVGDWDNFGKQVAEALEGVAYFNDKQIVTGLVRKRYAVHPHTGEDQPARWVITLQEIVDEKSDAGPGEAAFAGTWGAR